MRRKRAMLRVSCFDGKTVARPASTSGEIDTHGRRARRFRWSGPPGERTARVTCRSDAPCGPKCSCRARLRSELRTAFRYTATDGLVRRDFGRCASKDASPVQERVRPLNARLCLRCMQSALTPSRAMVWPRIRQSRAGGRHAAFGSMAVHSPLAAGGVRLQAEAVGHPSPERTAEFLGTGGKAAVTPWTQCGRSPVGHRAGRAAVRRTVLASPRSMDHSRCRSSRVAGQSICGADDGNVPPGADQRQTSPIPPPIS